VSVASHGAHGLASRVREEGEQITKDRWSRLTLEADNWLSAIDYRLEQVQVLQRRAIGTLMAGLSTGLARQLAFVLPLPDRHPPAQNARHHRATQAAKQCGDYCGRNRVQIPEHTEAGAAGTVRSCDPRASRHPGSGSGRYSASITSCHAPKSNHSTRLRYVLLELWKLGREAGPRFLAKPRFDFSVVSRKT